jgi:hypothetical protein
MLTEGASVVPDFLQELMQIKSREYNKMFRM